MEELMNLLDALKTENQRLRSALEWYADEARACAKNSHTGAHAAPQALLATVTVLALDGGRRADEAMVPNTGNKRRAKHVGLIES
jgi:hypothetical protein